MSPFNKSVIRRVFYIYNISKFPAYVSVSKLKSDIPDTYFKTPHNMRTNETGSSCN
jgi:hypothetical protein